MRFGKITFSNITTILLIIFALLMLFSPGSKAWLIGQLMKVGLFQPDVKEEKIQALSSGIKFKNGSGDIIDISELKNKVVFINLWATWCPPCRAEMPSIENLYQKMNTNENIAFFMVDVDNNYEKAKIFMDKEKYTLPVFTSASEMPESLFNGTLPTTLIFNKKGKLVFHNEGAADFTNKNLIEFLEKLSNE